MSGGTRPVRVGVRQRRVVLRIDEVREVRSRLDHYRRTGRRDWDGRRLTLLDDKDVSDVVRALHAKRMIRRGTYATPPLVPWRMSLLGATAAFDGIVL